MTISPITSVSARIVVSDAGRPVMLGAGPVARRECVLVTVTCEDGTTGYGEAFPGMASGVVRAAVEDVLAPAAIGGSPAETGELSALVRRRHLLAHSAASAIRLGLSGLDMAMWDAHGKALGVPVHALLGGSRTAFDVYAGGFALGIQPAPDLLREVRALVDAGWVNGVKLRIGTTPAEDLARVRAVRQELRGGARLMVDANYGQRYDAARIAPVLSDLGVEWLEEPYPRGLRGRYAALHARSPVPIAGGENLRGAEEFFDWLAGGTLDVAQPDCSRVGGITEMLRIAAVAGAAGVRFVPHISHSALNHAATLAVLSAIGSEDLCEGDASPINEFRDVIFSGGVRWGDGRAELTGGPGLGVAVDEEAVGRAQA